MFILVYETESLLLLYTYKGAYKVLSRSADTVFTPEKSTKVTAFLVQNQRFSPNNTCIKFISLYCWDTVLV